MKQSFRMLCSVWRSNYLRESASHPGQEKFPKFQLPPPACLASGKVSKFWKHNSLLADACQRRASVVLVTSVLKSSTKYRKPERRQKKRRRRIPNGSPVSPLSRLFLSMVAESYFQSTRRTLEFPITSLSRTRSWLKLLPRRDRYEARMVICCEWN